jgi:hypothetical protein
MIASLLDRSESPSPVLRTLICCVLVSLLTTPVVAADSPGHRAFNLNLVNGVVSGAPDTIRAEKGEELKLTWTSDKPMQLHLHGYDIEVTVSPNSPAVMSFKANIAGRFPVEQHGGSAGRHRPVLYLEVRP